MGNIALNRLGIKYVGKIIATTDKPIKCHIFASTTAIYLAPLQMIITKYNGKSCINGTSVGKKLARNSMSINIDNIYNTNVELRFSFCVPTIYLCKNIEYINTAK